MWDFRSDMTYNTLSLREMWDLVMMSQKITKMTTHYAPKNDQNDQSMTCLSGKLSGHYDLINDQNDYSLWLIIGSKWLVIRTPKMTKMTSRWVDELLPNRSLWPKKWPEWLLIMDDYWLIMSSHSGWLLGDND